MSGLCNQLLQQFSFHYIQTLHNDCSYIEDVHLLFCIHLMLFFFHFWGLELRHLFLYNAKRVSGLGYLYLQKFSFLNIQTLHKGYSYIEHVHLPFCAHLINIFLFFRSVELRYFVHPKC